MKKLLLLILALLFACCFPKEGKQNIPPQKIERLKTQEELCFEQKQRMQQNLIEAKQEKQQWLAEQKQALEMTLQFFDKSFNTYQHCKTETTIQDLAEWFGTCSALIQKVENTDNAGSKELASRLKGELIKCQSVAFPILRQEYAKITGNKIRITHDDLGFIGGSHVDYVAMNIHGNKNSAIAFSWWGLAADKNKANFQRKMLYILTVLRFTRVKLQINAYDSEPSYFKPFEGKDTDLVAIHQIIIKNLI